MRIYDNPEEVQTPQDRSKTCTRCGMTVQRPVHPCWKDGLCPHCLDCTTADIFKRYCDDDEPDGSGHKRKVNDFDAYLHKYTLHEMARSEQRDRRVFP